VLVTSDHGGKGHNHGKNSLAEIEIPWILAGPAWRRAKSPLRCSPTIQAPRWPGFSSCSRRRAGLEARRGGRFNPLWWPCGRWMTEFRLPGRGVQPGPAAIAKRAAPFAALRAEGGGSQP